MATHSFMRLFRGTSVEEGQSVRPSQNKHRLTRRSSGMAELARILTCPDTLCVLDIGSTSATNIRYLTELGHKPYSEDLLDASTDPSLMVRDELGQMSLDDKRFLSENLTYPAAQFDVVMCWNLADYMDETLVRPVVARLWSALKPEARCLLSFTRKRQELTHPVIATTLSAQTRWRCSISKPARINGKARSVRHRMPTREDFACNASSIIDT